MKWCKGCNKVLADITCPTCGERGVNTQIIHRCDSQDSSIRRRVSTITEEDPNNDDLTRANEDA
jgi:predicted RNA-binding protein with PUA domain